MKRNKCHPKDDSGKIQAGWLNVKHEVQFSHHPLYHPLILLI